MQDDRRAQAIEAIRSAQRELVRVAAQLQSKGIDTTPLLEPMHRIHTALTVLEGEDGADGAEIR